MPYYGRAWSTASAALTPEHLGHEVRRVGGRPLRDRPRVRRPVRPQVRPGRGRRLDGLPAPELHHDLRLRDAVARSSTTTTPTALGREVRPRQPVRTCAASGSGRSATTAPGPSSTRSSRTSSSPTRSRRSSPRRRLSAPVVLAERRRPPGHGHRERHRDRADPLRLVRSSRSLERLGRDRRSRRAPRTGRAVALHLGRARGRRHGRPRRPLPDHRLDRRRLGQPRRAVARRGRRSTTGARSLAATAIARPRSRPTATAGSTARRCDLTASEPVSGPARVLDPSGVDRAALDVQRGDHGRLDLGRHGRARAAAVRDGRYTFRVDGVDRAGNRTVRDATVLVDRTIRLARPGRPRRSTRAARRPTERLSFSLTRPAHRDGRDLPGHDARPDDLGRPGRRRAARSRWTWNGKTAAGDAGPAGHLPGRRSRATSCDRRRPRLARTVTVKAPQLTGRAPRTLAGDDRPTPHAAVRRDRRRPARGRGRLGRPADLQRGRERRARSPPPSSRPCRPRPCSSSTTARPTARAGSPTSWPPRDPRIRVRHRAAKAGPRPGLSRRLRASPSTAAPTIVVQMDADFSHDPAVLPELVAPIVDGRRRPRHRLALRAGRRGRRLGPSAAGSSRAAAACSRGSSWASVRAT